MAPKEEHVFALTLATGVLSIRRLGDIYIARRIPLWGCGWELGRGSWEDVREDVRRELRRMDFDASDVELFSPTLEPPVIMESL